MREKRWTQGTQVLSKLHGRYDLLSQTAEIKTARIVESNSINHGGRLNTCINNYFGLFQSKNMKNYYFNWCIRNPDETDSDFDDIISNSFGKIKNTKNIYTTKNTY